MTDMEEKLSGDFLFDLQYIRASVSQLDEETATLVEALNNLGDHRYESLIDSLRRIIGEVQEALNQRREIQEAPLTISLISSTWKWRKWWGARTPTWEK